jgi:DNA-binding response OmpR family regulator
MEPDRRNDRGSCVLVVEDDTPLRKLLTLTLKRERLTVTTVADGAEAIDALARESFRVVLLDLMMPRISGWDVIEWLKGHPSELPRTVIVVTAADRNVFAELDPEIVNAIIVKPFDTYELAGYVKRCCEAPVERDRRSKRLVGHA